MSKTSQSRDLRRRAAKRIVRELPPSEKAKNERVKRRHSPTACNVSTCPLCDAETLDHLDLG